MTEPISAERLRAFVQSVQHSDAEIAEKKAVIAELQKERRELFKMIKEAGIDVTIFRQMMARMAKDPLEVIEADALLESYEVLMGTGAQAAGTLATRRDDEGRFVVEIVQAPPAETKPTTRQSTRRTHIALAEAARRAREQ
jgi:uncharacterized protein (UPF0335 family)